MFMSLSFSIGVTALKAMPLSACNSSQRLLGHMLGQHSRFENATHIVRRLALEHLPADDHVSEDVDDNQQVVVGALDRSGQPRTILTTQKIGCTGVIRCRPVRTLGRFGTPAVGSLSVGAQHPVKGRDRPEIPGFLVQ